jgi:hypothetical protein
MQESHRRGFCVVVSLKDGVFNARLYCVGDYRRDCEAMGPTPLAAIEHALKRAGQPCPGGPTNEDSAPVRG